MTNWIARALGFHGRPTATPEKAQVVQLLEETQVEWEEAKARVDPVLEEVERVENLIEHRYRRRRVQAARQHASPH